MKTVLVTGASSGFGKLAVDLLLERNWRVIASMRDAQERSEIWQQWKEAYGERFELLSLDITNRQQIDDAADTISNLCPDGLDALINNAGFGLFGALEDVSPEQFEYQMQVNVIGTANVTRRMLPFIRKAKGRILFVSSVLGVTALPLCSSYCASKFAVEGLAESLKLELQPYGVQVALVEPGGFRTNFAKAVVWGEHLNTASNFHDPTRNYQAFMKKLAQRPKAPDPKRVAEKMVELCESRKLPLRNFVGNDAKLASLTHRLMPESLRLAMFGSFTRKVWFDAKT